MLLNSCKGFYEKGTDFLLLNLLKSQFFCFINDFYRFFCHKAHFKAIPVICQNVQFNVFSNLKERNEKKVNDISLMESP